MNKTIHCSGCGAKIEANTKFCSTCGKRHKPPIYKRVWFWLVMIFIVFPSGCSILIPSSDENSDTTLVETTTTETGTNDTTNTTERTTPHTAFEGHCGIEAYGEMGSSIIGFPELSISITNVSDKDISAIQFYAVPYDVYGDEIKGWTSQNRLYTDTVIGVGKSDSIYYQFIEDSIKTIKLYVYSVYFSDGTEWGNKDAAKSVILENGTLIEVFGES